MDFTEVSRSFVTEHGLWLAAVAATAGLMLAVRWLLQARAMSGRALRALGGVQTEQHGASHGLRFAAVVAVSVMTIFALTPARHGTGIMEVAPPAQAPSATPLSTQATVIVIVSQTDEFVISVQGDAIVEVRLQAAVAASARSAQSEDPDASTAAASIQTRVPSRPTLPAAE